MNEEKKEKLTDDRLSEVTGGTHEKQEEFLCSSCGNVFPSMKALEEHMATCIASFFDP